MSGSDTRTTAPGLVEAAELAALEIALLRDNLAPEYWDKGRRLSRETLATLRAALQAEQERRELEGE